VSPSKVPYKAGMLVIEIYPIEPFIEHCAERGAA